MADDMGFSDLGSYGGEINTPNLDALAGSGVRYTNFYNTGRCSPTRAALLSGQYSHNVGMGELPSTNYNSATRGNGTMPGYSGWYAGTDPLTNETKAGTPTLPEVLKSAGYATAMSGKWHLTRSNTISSGPNGTWPMDRGFDRFYGTMEGAKDYFEPVNLVDTDTASTFEPPVDPGYFYTNAISQRGADFIRDAASDPSGDPFFHYHAFYAPHFPLQAPADAVDAQGNNLIAKYQAIYAAGWDQLRSDRLANQIAMGIFPVGTQLSDKSESDAGILDWSALNQTQRDEVILRMSIYAAQVEILDQNVGSLLAALDDPDNDPNTNDSVRDNTVVMFISDNGGQGGPDWNGGGSLDYLNGPIPPGESINVRYGNGWANLSDTPFKRFKGDAYEGGIASPLIVSGPGVAAGQPGSVNTSDIAHVVDIMPTIMQYAQADYPTAADATELEGESLVGSFSGAGDDHSERSVFFEHRGNRGTRVGNWKMVAENGGANYQLFDVVNDRGESTNLANENPHVIRELRQQWEAWAERNQVANRSLAEAGSPFLEHEEIDWIGQRKAQSSLQLHLKFDDGSYTNGASVADSSGSNFSAVLDTRGDANNHAVASSVSGLGGALDFDGGSTGDIVDVDMRSDIALGNQGRSIALWFNADAIGNRRIVGYGDPDGSFLDGSLMLLTMDGVDPNDALMRVRLGGVNVDFEPGQGNEIGVGEWVHVVLNVAEDAQSSADIGMFINGVAVSGVVEGGGQHTALRTGMSWLGIGRRGTDGPGGTQNGFDFDGQIGDLQIYDATLTAQDALFLFQNPGEALAGVPGDYNGDGEVDADDYASWRLNFGAVGAATADGNEDQMVTAADYAIWRDLVQSTTVQLATEPAVVPEPATIVLGLPWLVASHCHWLRAKASQQDTDT